MLTNLGIGVLIIYVLWLINLVFYKPFNIDHFYERVFFEYGLDDPELMSRLHMLDSYGINYYDGQLTDISVEHRNDRYNTMVVRNLDMLRSYRISKQTTEQKLSTDILSRYFESEIFRYFLADHDFQVNHISGVHVELPRFMIEVHKIDNLQDAENYLKRLSKFDEKLTQLMNSLDAQEANGIMAPARISDIVIHDIQVFLNPVIQFNILYRDFENKINKAEIMEYARHEMLLEAKSIIEDEVYPAYNKYMEFLEDQKIRSHNTTGVWHLPNGPQYYAEMLRLKTSTDSTAEEINAIGLEQLERSKERVFEIAASLNLKNFKTPGELFTVLYNTDSLRYTDTDEDIDEMLEEFQIYAQKAVSAFPKLFKNSIKLNLKVLRMPDHLERTQELVKLYIPDHSSDVAYLYVNISRIDFIPKYMIPTLAYREILGTYVREWEESHIKGLPTFRKILKFDVFNEGWNEYALFLAEEHGLYETPLHLLGRYQYELITISTMVTDTGIHARKWEWEQAELFLSEYTGFPKEVLELEVNKIVVLPGQACMNGIGFSRFMELRMFTEGSLEDKFSLKEFHFHLLKNGKMPLPVLNKQIHNYVNQVMNSPLKTSTK